MFSAAQYRQQLQALLPQGIAWPREDAAPLTRLLDGFSDELGRLDARAEQLVREANPRTTLELLPDWERVAGLPDACTVSPTEKTIEQRRAALLRKLASLGGQSRAYFVSLCSVLGFNVTITEFDLHTCMSDCMVAVNGLPWRYAWRINVATAETVSYFTVTDTCSTPLASWGNAEFECVLTRLKPAHTILIFAYGP